jgi:hypothetical protein
MSTIHPALPEVVPLYYASLCSFCGLAEHLTAHSSDVNSRGGSHTTPLHAVLLFTPRVPTSTLYLDVGTVETVSTSSPPSPLAHLSIPKTGCMALPHNPVATRNNILVVLSTTAATPCAQLQGHVSTARDDASSLPASTPRAVNERHPPTFPRSPAPCLHRQLKSRCVAPFRRNQG